MSLFIGVSYIYQRFSTWALIRVILCVACSTKATLSTPEGKHMVVASGL